MVVALGLVVTGCAGDDTDAGDAAATPPSGAAITSALDAEACGWSTAGADLHRLHATTCHDTIDEADVDRLAEAWFTPTRQEVTAAPAVDDDRLYVGDWSGRMYALDR